VPHRDGPVSVADVQQIISAVLGMGCPIGVN
jgi:hypothetical protein